MAAFGEAEEDGVGTAIKPRMRSTEDRRNAACLIQPRGAIGIPGEPASVRNETYMEGEMVLLSIGADDAALQELQDISLEAGA